MNAPRKTYKGYEVKERDGMWVATNPAYRYSAYTVEGHTLSGLLSLIDGMVNALSDS